MKLKLNDAGLAFVQDGKPVYFADDGKEIPFDSAQTIATISRLNGEAKGHREAKEAAEAKLKAFEGIVDPAAARDALEKMKSIDQKKLVDAGEVEKVKAEIKKALEDQYAPVVKEAADLKSQLYGERIGGAFARSKFITDKAAIPADMMQSRFGQQFKFEDGKIIPYDASGNRIFSRSKPGEIAEFEEAMEVIVDQYPYKDQILKGSGGTGGGARPSNGGASGAKVILRSEFEKLDPTARAGKMKEGFTLAD
jgi:hypothetical protein